MVFSNRHTNEFVNLCDLENVLDGVSVCYADSELLLRKSLKNIVIPDSDPESEVGKWTNAFVGQILSQAQNDTKGMASADHSCHCERSEAIQNSELILVNSELKNSTHYSPNDNGIFPPVQSKIASLCNGGIVMLRLPKPCTSASLFRLHIGSRDGGVK